MSNYEALGSTGCSIGQYAFTAFNFPDVGQEGPLSPSSITVTPTTAGSAFGFDFAGAFAVPPSQTVQYAITYQIDPPPPILRFTTDMNNGQITPEVFQDATLQIDTYLCIASTVTGLPSSPGCSDSSQPFHLVANLTNPNATSGITPTTSLGVANLITLTGNSTGGSFTDFTNLPDAAPEPSTFVMLGIGVLGLAFVRRVSARRRRAS